MITTEINLNPNLGDRMVLVRKGSNGWNVHVQIFKANSLRGDSYWVTEAFKSYSKETDARRYASRFL